MVRAKTEKGVATHRLLLDGREATLDLGGRVEWALLNEGGHGFYRVRYAPDLLAVLTATSASSSRSSASRWSAIRGPRRSPGLMPLARISRDGAC